MIAFVAGVGLVAAIGVMHQPGLSAAALGSRPQAAPGTAPPSPPAHATSWHRSGAPSVIDRARASTFNRTAQAPNVPPAGRSYPDFAHLKAFSRDTNYMSLPGYVRYWVHEEQGRWITTAEAKEILKASGQPAKRLRASSRLRPVAVRYRLRGS